MEGKAGERQRLAVASSMSHNLTLFRAPMAGPSVVRVKVLSCYSKPWMVDKPGRRSPPHSLDCHPERSEGSQAGRELVLSLHPFSYEAYSRRKPTSIVV